MTNWVIDWETLKNCSVLVAEDCKEDRRQIFIIHKLCNHFKELVRFLEGNKERKEWHIGFNNLMFDSQITEYILRNKDKLGALPPEEIAMKIYEKSQDIIDRSNAGEFQEFGDKQLSIKQVDVFKLNHWDNPAKSSSLKWIQYSMDWYNIQEMPIHHSTWITTMSKINTIVEYCINDVKSTKNIMILSKDQINLRATLSQEYNLPLQSASEPRISKELFLHFLSGSTGIQKYELRQLRTRRSIINLKDIILPYTEFQSEPFKKVLDSFKRVSIDANATKGGFKYSMNYKGVKTDFGLGGVHGAKEAGIYKSGNGMIIMTSDVTSFYPRLAMVNKWSPAHLPKEDFTEQYQWFFDERQKIDKKNIKNYVYKIILNSTFGLSIDKNSFLYDPLFGMQITINGQLSLMMLYEMLAEKIPGCIPLMQNTDGIEMIIPEDWKDEYLTICEDWQRITGLNLEHDEYDKIILADVNNYIAVNKQGKVKSKGRFEFENLALHKNKSFLIIPKAIQAYFINDIPPEKFLADNRNIFDYCAGVKIKGEWKFQETCVIKGEVIKRDLQKVLRYYISEEGCKIVKTNIIDGREIQVESGKWLQREFNKFENKKWVDYGVDDSYYLEKIYKEINNILPKKELQLDLFSS